MSKLKGLFEIQQDYIAGFGGDIDVWIIKDTESGEFIKSDLGFVEWYSYQDEAQKMADKLNKDRIFEKIVLS